MNRKDTSGSSQPSRIAKNNQQLDQKNRERQHQTPAPVIPAGSTTAHAGEDHTDSTTLSE